MQAARPGPTTAPLMQPVGPQVPDEQHVQQVLDLCMRMGEVLLASGEGSGETTDTMLRVANAFGVATVDVDIAFTAGTICCHRGMAATPIISLRVVKYRALDLTLLATVYRLVEDVERGRLDLLAAASTLDRAVQGRSYVPPLGGDGGPRGPGRRRCAAAGGALGRCAGGGR